MRETRSEGLTALASVSLMQLHNEIQASLRMRHKVSYSVPLSPNLVRIWETIQVVKFTQFGKNHTELLYLTYTKYKSKEEI